MTDVCLRRGEEGEFSVVQGFGLWVSTAEDTSSIPACCAQSLSCICLSAAPWTVACQAPLSMKFSRQEHWSRLPFPTSGDLPDPGIEHVSPALEGGLFTTH